MNKWNTYIHKRLYNKIALRIVTANNYDVEYDRYILDLQDGFVFYYLLTGKIVKEQQKNGYTERICYFRNEDTPYQLIDKIKALLNEIKL